MLTHLLAASTRSAQTVTMTRSEGRVITILFTVHKAPTDGGLWLSVQGLDQYTKREITVMKADAVVTAPSENAYCIGPAHKHESPHRMPCDHYERHYCTLPIKWRVVITPDGCGEALYSLGFVLEDKEG